MGKTMKKILCAVLVVVMCLTSAPLQGFVGLELPDFSEWFGSKASAASEGYYTYIVTNGDAIITDVYTSISGDVVIPSTLGGYSVTTIDDRAFYYCESLTSITIPVSVTTIGDRVFYGCDSLTNVTIPDSVTSIGDEAFAYCYSLTSVTIPDSVTSIGDRTFYYCESLTSITIPDSVTTIGDRAFSNCESLTSVAIPDSVMSIGYEAFYSCGSLTSVTIPDSVTSIGDYAFAYCDSLTSVTIPDSVTTIGDYGFSSCTGITSIEVPDSVTSIGIFAFNSCHNLKDIKLSNNLTLIGSCAFTQTPIEKITIPESVTGIGGGAFALTPIKNIEIPDSVEILAGSNFVGCYFLEDVKLSSNITEISEYMFNGCLSLENITIPESVITIGECSFSGCHRLKNIIIPKGVTGIEQGTFADCWSLKEITLPSNISTIGEYSFETCFNLENAYIYNKTVLLDDSSLCLTNYGAKDGVDSFKWVEEYVLAELNFMHGKITEEEHDEIMTRLDNSIIFYDTPQPIGTIHCYAGSTAQTYAETYGIDYVLFEDYIPSTTEATCITKGCVTYTCPCGCGDSYSVEDNYNPNNHEGETEIRDYVAPTCTADGYTGDTYCLGCGELIEKGEVIPATGHKDEDGDDICDNCGADLGGEDEGGGDGDGGSGEGGSGSECEHSPIEVPLVNATCTQGGMSYDICSECGETLSEIYDTDALGHDMSDFIQTTAPTCIEKGEERAECSRCDYYETREINEYGHKFGEWTTVKYPTAKETGLKQRTCSVCGETEEEIIDKLPALIDEKTGIIIEYPAENYNGKPDMIIKEALDETAINIVNAVGSVAKNKVYDITLTLNGVAIQPVGKVTIRIPLPADYTAERTYVYYLNLATRVPEKLEARYEDGYMVFETDHFSYYALAEIPDIDNCSCNCHASGIKKFFFNFILFFQKLFKKNAVCACGVAHY